MNTNPFTFGNPIKEPARFHGREPFLSTEFSRH